MTGETQRPGPENQDSSLERASKDLREYQVKEGDTRAEIQAKLVKLQTDRDALQDDYELANMEKRYKETAKLFAVMTQMDELIKAQETAQSKAPYEDAPAPQAKMERGADRLKDKAAYEAEIKKQSAIIDSKDPSVKPEQKQAAQEARAEAQEALQKLEAKEKRDHAMETVSQYKAEEARSRAEEQVELTRLEAEMNGEKPAEGSKEGEKKPDEKKEDEAVKGDENKAETKVEGTGTLSERADNFAHSMLTSIAGDPPTTAFEKFTTSSKTFMVKLALAIAGEGEHTWGRKFDTGQKYILEKVTGLKITEDGASKQPPPDDKKYKLEWGEPDPEFQGPSKTTQDVFAQYFGTDKWVNTYQRICDTAEGKPKISDVEATYSNPPTEEDLKLQALIKDLGVEDKNSSFLDAVAKRGYRLIDKKPREDKADDKAPGAPERTPDQPGRLSMDFAEYQDIFNKSLLKLIDAKNFNSQTGIVDLLKTAFPVMIHDLLNSPDYIQQMQLVLNLLPPDTVKKGIEESTTLKPEEKAQCLEEFEKSGKVPETFFKSMIPTIEAQITSYFQSAEFDKFIVRMADVMSPEWKDALLKNTSYAALVESDITAGHDVENNTAILAALKANDPVTKPAVPEVTPSSPTAS